MQLTDRNHYIQAYLSAPVESGYCSYVIVYQDITSKSTTLNTVAGNITVAGYYTILPGPEDSNTTRNVISIDFSNKATGTANLTVSFIDSSGSSYPIGIKTMAGNSDWGAFITWDHWDRAGMMILDSADYKLQAALSATVATYPVYYIACYQDTNTKGTTTYTIGGSISGTSPVDIVPGPTNSNTERKILSLNFCNNDSLSATISILYVTDQTQSFGIKSLASKESWDPLSIETISTGGGGGTVTSITTTAPITGGTITTSGTMGITQAGVGTDGYLSSADWNTFNNKQGAITLTTTGDSGPATLVGSTLNVPQYTSVSKGFVIAMATAL